ncbi:MAG: HAD-IA family hydrolase, partial [Christensenellaceae bacterium]
DTKYACMLAIQKALYDLYQQEYSPAELENTFGIPTKKAANHFGITDIEQFEMEIDKNYSVFIKQHAALFPNMLKTLQTLHKKQIPLGIITSKSRWEYDHDFTYFDLKKYFPISLCTEDTMHHKPHPEPVLAYLKLTNYKNPLFIGDTIYDLLCAKSAGISFAFAQWSKNHLSEKPDYIFSDPLQVLDYV